MIFAGEAIVAWRWGVWKIYISETGENTIVNNNLDSYFLSSSIYDIVLYHI